MVNVGKYTSHMDAMEDIPFMDIFRCACFLAARTMATTDAKVQL